MTNPFTAFAFPATGTSTNRTLPARLSDIHNVRDFGAVGDGSTDDLAAINAALNYGQVTLVATANGSGNVLTFAGGVPATVVSGMYPADVTTPSAFDPDALPHVASTTSTTVTLNGSAAGVSSGDTVTFNLPGKGIIFFPPGNFYVSAPIDFVALPIEVAFIGVAGATVTGNFADYVFRRGRNTSNADGGVHVIQGLTIVNLNATGGGIRLGLCAGGAIKDCIVTANLGINTASVDTGGSIPSQEISIENCTLSPGSNPTGSVGIMSVADGPILNCTITGFAVGMRTWGQQGGSVSVGCRFELCAIGFQPGALPGGGPGSSTGCDVRGCYFLNCGRAIALDFANGQTISGVRIESTNATVFGSTPASGIDGPDALGSAFEGIYITGQFSNAGVDLSAVTTSFVDFSIYKSIVVNNTGSGANWKPPGTAEVAKFTACNISPTYTMSELPAVGGFSTSATWLANSITGLGTLVGGSGYVDGNYFSVPLTGGSGTGAVADKVVVQSGAVLSVSQNGFPDFDILPTGSNYAVNDTLSASNSNLGGSGSGFSIKVTTVANTATLTLSGVNLSPFISAGVTFNINVQGMSLSGYDGLFTGAIATGVFTMSYALPSNPGGSGSGGTVALNPVNDTGRLNALEGDCYNVSDANTATWGAIPVGGGSTHAKVRWQGAPTNWTVVGI